MMAQHLACENVWLDKHLYEDAERIYHERKAKDDQTPLADEVGRARQWLTNLKNSINEPLKSDVPETNANASIEDYICKLEKIMMSFEDKLNSMMDRVTYLEEITRNYKPPIHSVDLTDVPKTTKEEADNDVDLFGSDSEEDEAALQVRQKRLADYEAKKSKKAALIAKSNIILDVKPWDDETDMKQMEQVVRGIQAEGLVWGAAKLVPLAFGIYKLQISCVVEDELISVDWLQEQIESIEEFVQSVDIAAFNKV